MDNALKVIIVFLVFTTGCTVITEASKLRCYISINDYVEYESKDIEKMMDEAPYFTKDIATFLWVHGFNATITGPAITTMITGALEKGGWNVCLWNWVEETRASDLLGPLVSYGLKFLKQVKWTGYEMADSFIRVTGKGLNLDRLHAYGHSIGSHALGYCGRRLKLKGLQIARIYGLDNAGPLYEKFKDSALRQGDAKYVGCLHTDPGKKGINSSLCDVDMWANYLEYIIPEGSEAQPNCTANTTTTDFSRAGLCSHDYSWKLINSSFFNDFPISFGIDYWTWARSNGTATPRTLLGEKTDITLRGNAFFSALGVWPYTLGEDGLRP